MESLITDLSATVNSIKEDVTELKSSKSKVSNVQVAVSKIEETVNEDTVKIKLLSAIVIKQDARIAQ